MVFWDAILVLFFEAVTGFLSGLADIFFGWFNTGA